MAAYRRYTFARNDLLFTMSDNTRMQTARERDALHARICFYGRVRRLARRAEARGYRPVFALRAPTRQPSSRFASEGWWSQTESNRRPPACKAGALPTELWPRATTGLPSRSSRQSARLRLSGSGAAAFSRFASEGWWAWEDLNFRPHAYQARALTN